MKWFLFSLFMLVMCGCGSSKVSSNLDTSERNLNSFESNLNSYLLDTTRILRVIFDNSKFKFIETINIMEYDAESGKPVKETKAKREVVQDTDQVLAEEERQTVTHQNKLEVDHFIDASKKVESEVTEETEDDSVAFWREIGRYIGIIIAFVLAFKIFWRPLKEKF